MATTNSETDRSDNDRKLLPFGRENNGISQTDECYVCIISFIRSVLALALASALMPWPWPWS